MRALSTLCKSLLICFTSSLISTPLKMGDGRFHRRRNCPLSPPFSKVDRGVFLKSYLRAKPDHRGRRNERRSCFALAPSLDRRPAARAGALKIIAAPSNAQDRHRRSAGDRQDSEASGPTDPRPAACAGASSGSIPNDLRSQNRLPTQADGAARSEFERCGAIRNKSRASDRSADLADRSNTAIFTKLSDD